MPLPSTFITADGSNSKFDDSKFTKFLLMLSTDLPSVEITRVHKLVIEGLSETVTQHELYDLISDVCIQQALFHSDYEHLATRVLLESIYLRTPNTFEECTLALVESGAIDGKIMNVLSSVFDDIERAINHDRDRLFSYFGLKTLMKSYLLKNNANSHIERPQFMMMRVALAIHGDDLCAAIETYEHMSKLDIIHASPTMFNAGTKSPQMSSCYIMCIEEDSIEGIFETFKKCAYISKYAGGIGISISNVRARGSRIKGTNGTSDGIVSMLRVANAVARYVNQGGRRKGAIACFLEPWHADTMEFLELRKNRGDEELRTRDLFLGLWVPDLFMKRVEKDEMWSLMCPSECPGLNTTYGEDFEELYVRYEQGGNYIKQLPARRIWERVVTSQSETGLPYLCFKDSVNRKNNQKHIGTIRSSNLCTEIMEFTSENEIAVCNLASVSLPSCVKNDTFDFVHLSNMTRILVRNLNKIIDANMYPLEESKKSNLTHRPIGVGVQGLADCFMMLGMAYGSQDSQQLNVRIFETLYHSALSESMLLAKKHGHYPSFNGSELSLGKFQFDLWDDSLRATVLTLEWDQLRKDIMVHGVRNSLLIAPMPTATTSQIMGNTESFEPLTSNLYLRRTLAGEFVCINKRLQALLQSHNIWSKDLADRIIRAKGSIQGIEEVPTDVRTRFKTVWEISQRLIIIMAADRGRFIDQSQSMNLYIDTPSYQVVTSMHFFSWMCGLKTGMYYMRTRAASEKTIDNNIDNSIACSSCSS